MNLVILRFHYHFQVTHASFQAPTELTPLQRELHLQWAYIYKECYADGYPIGQRDTAIALLNNAQRNKSTVLHGATGSGKTAIMVRSVESDLIQ